MYLLLEFFMGETTLDDHSDETCTHYQAADWDIHLKGMDEVLGTPSSPTGVCTHSRPSETVQCLLFQLAPYTMQSHRDRTKQ